MAVASSVAPLAHESAEQVVSEEGWELSGSKTFKRNRKNRSSVKSSAVPALPGLPTVRRHYGIDAELEELLFGQHVQRGRRDGRTARDHGSL